jgi:hypothetical protein
VTNPHRSMGHSTDSHPVRPGSSDALTARTIDATQHTPLVRAQETVAALIPRVAAPLGSPLLIAMLGLTLVLLWTASRMRFRPSALLLSAMLVMTLTSFRPMKLAETAQTSDGRIADTPQSWMQYKDRDNSRGAEPTPFAVEVSAPEEPMEPVDPTPRYDPPLPPMHITLPPELTQIPPAIMQLLEREDVRREMRRAMRELQFRLRQEARDARRRQRHWHY